MKLLLFVVVLVVLLLIVKAAKEEDRVTKLPGLKGDLPSAHYSGYLPVGALSGTKGQLHYWFIESTKDPKNDPISLWLNGGPVRTLSSTLSMTLHYHYYYIGIFFFNWFTY